MDIITKFDDRITVINAEVYVGDVSYGTKIERINNYHRNSFSGCAEAERMGIKYACQAIFLRDESKEKLQAILDDHKKQIKDKIEKHLPNLYEYRELIAKLNDMSFEDACQLELAVENDGLRGGNYHEENEYEMITNRIKEIETDKLKLYVEAKRCLRSNSDIVYSAGKAVINILEAGGTFEEANKQYKNKIYNID